MGTTRIEWCDKSWNIITGCSKISEGCRNCYAERMSKRLAGRFGYPKDDPFRITFHPDRLEEPLKWKKPKRVFICSMGDLFHDDVKPEWIDAVLDVMAACPQHTFIIITKRPQNIDSKVYEPTKTWPVRKLGPFDYLLNLWLGVSVENQAAADERIPILLQIPAAKHIVSIEPMLGFINLNSWLWHYCPTRKTAKGVRWDLYHTRPTFNWVILGGETGPGARSMNPDWARAVRDQCREAGVPFFFKQMSRKQPIPADLMIREFSKQRR